MRDEIQHIIEHMSPIELCMLEDHGVVLPNHLAAMAADFRSRGNQAVYPTMRYRQQYHKPSHALSHRRTVA